MNADLEHDTQGATWVKSSLSFANGNCVEVAALPQDSLSGAAIAVRDSQDPDGTKIGFIEAAWAEFLDVVRGLEGPDQGLGSLDGPGLGG